MPPRYAAFRFKLTRNRANRLLKRSPNGHIPAPDRRHGLQQLGLSIENADTCGAIQLVTEKP
jgi:hypothetical protein